MLLMEDAVPLPKFGRGASGVGVVRACLGSTGLLFVKDHSGALDGRRATFLEVHMGMSDRQLLIDAISRHKACLQGIAGIRDSTKALRRVIELEEASWSESQIEIENRPLEYRHLMSLTHDPAIIEQRYIECGHDYLKEIIAQRYFEVLGNITDMGKLMALATEVHPDLRRLAVIRFQQMLPKALQEVHARNLPVWFTRLLRQPSEMSNFLSEPSCRAIFEKAKSIVEGS